MKRSESIRSSGHYTGFIVQAFRSAREHFMSGSDPVEDQFLMRRDHVRDFPHGGYSTPLDPMNPSPHKRPRPRDASIIPEMSESLLEEVGPSRLKAAAQQPVQLFARLSQYA